ncbi:hypothetical protein PAPYR_2478 [Paratrimastix pyriformis]|uniref:RING-type domain-containing protein n=1 Tax=Paratrimastix pyriformis TaxID=342808 RepID=A0ABQ8UWA2_9EUKA|nr:hypothetical protein PAPYR_2478 [Paratrimastix pyriformis]
MGPGISRTEDDELAVTSFEGLQELIGKATINASLFPDPQGHVFRFVLNSYSAIRWRDSCVVLAVLVHPDTGNEIGYTTLTVPQFEHVCVKLWQFVPLQKSTLKQLRSLSPGEAPPDECMICMSHPIEITLPCTHSFCNDCFQSWLAKSQTCPYCRQPTNGSPDDIFVMPTPTLESMSAELSELIRGYGFLPRPQHHTERPPHPGAAPAPGK